MAIGVFTFLYDETKADALINLQVSVNKPVANNGMANNQVNTINNNVQPQVQVQPKIVSYDPMTGQPIYSNQNNN